MSVVEVKWHEVESRKFDNLPTGVHHLIKVKREALPVILVPGIMGSRLRQQATGDVVWDPPDGIGSAIAALWTWGVRGNPARRRRWLIGESGDYFSDSYLEVDLASEKELKKKGAPEERAKLAFERGWGGVHWSSYGELLIYLEDELQKLEPLKKVFTFPVYACGYNWTDTNRSSGAKLAARITEIKGKHNNADTFCDRVIVVTHSMGGLVTRAALKQAENDIAGVVHGVQPVNGAAAAYKRMRAGFEGVESAVLGYNGQEVTAVLANAPGGLELLPNKQYRSKKGGAGWLVFTDRDRKVVRRFPADGDPYAEIYEKRDVLWRLVNPDWIDPDYEPDSNLPSPWGPYRQLITKARQFHDEVYANGQPVSHKRTWGFYGSGSAHRTFDEVTYSVVQETEVDGYDSTYLMQEEPPPAVLNELNRGTLRAGGSDGLGREAAQAVAGNRNIVAKLQRADGEGDGTVPELSGAALVSKEGKARRAIPGIDHQGAYNDATSRAFTLQAIQQIAYKWFEEQTGQ